MILQQFVPYPLYFVNHHHLVFYEPLPSAASFVALNHSNMTAKLLAYPMRQKPQHSPGGPCFPTEGTSGR